MVLEVALIDIRPSQEDSFVEAYRTARLVLLEADGVHSVHLARGVESSSRFVLQVEWADVTLHEAFRASELFTSWRQAVGPFFMSPPAAEHYTPV